jgi:ribulose-5-phosphate 4-epimerase/fuculose-1-phosphate aldolase
MQNMLPRTDQERKEQLAATITELYRAGLVTASGGNLSVRCASRDDAVWITPSRIFKGGLSADEMIMIDFDGRRMDVEGNPDGNPSVEAVYHAGILKRRPEINSVIHTHAPLATVFAMCDMQMPPITTEAIFMMGLPVIPWAMGGSRELADYMIEYVGNTNAGGAFLRNHGLVTIGRNLREAADATYSIEHTIRILLLCKMTGKEPSVIPQETVDLLLNYLKMMATAA